MRKLNKKPVARRATPEQQIISYPPPDSLKLLSSAKDVLSIRHKELSLSVLSWELGGVNRGTISRVISGAREPSPELMAKLNSAYGCHVHAKTARIIVSICPICGEVPTPKHKCKAVSAKPRRKYDLTNKEVRAIAVSLIAKLNVRSL